MRRHRLAFSLLELSVALAVVALVAGFGISLSASLISGTKRVTTQQRLVTIRQALDTFAARNGYLPCPASRALSTSAANFGAEQRSGNLGLINVSITNPGTGFAPGISAAATVNGIVYINGVPDARSVALRARVVGRISGSDGVTSAVVAVPGSGFSSADNITVTFTKGTLGIDYLTPATATATVGYTCALLDASMVSTSGIYIGAIPTDTLGLSNTYAADAWGNKFLYAVSARHISGQESYATVPGPITIRYGDRSGVNYDIATGNDITTNPTAWGATYAVVSHGPDGKGAFALQRTTATTPCPTLFSSRDFGNNDNENCDDTNAVFYDTDYNDGSQAAMFFDDYIIWGTNFSLRRPQAHLVLGNTAADAIATAGYGALGDPRNDAGCSPGVCETWCAPCLNVPTQSVDGAAYVCQSTIVSNIPCKADCTYAYFGKDPTGKTVNIPCPQ